MNLVTLNQNNNNLSMTSREIADLTDKRHDNVLRDIEAMFNQLELNNLNYEATYLDKSNRYKKEYTLDKDLTMTLISGYSTVIRFRIIKRWQELEEQVEAPALPTTYLEALKALISSEEQKLEIQHQLEAAAPKINHYDTVVDRTGLVIATNIGNKLGVSATKLNRLLDDLDVYNKRTNKRAFKQWFIDSGYGIAKQANMGFNQCLFTLKGEAWIVEQLTMSKAVPEADIERIEARTNHTNSVIDRIDSLLAY